MAPAPQALGVLLLDPVSLAAQLNPTLCELLGYAAGEADGRHVAALVAPEHCELIRQVLAQGAAGEVGAHGAAITYLSKQGERLALWTTIAGAAGTAAPGPRPLYVAPPVTPVVEARRCVDHVLKDICAGVLLTDAAMKVVAVNRAFTSITGYREEDIVGRSPRLLRSGRHTAAFYRDMWQAIQRDGCWHGEVWNRRRNGDVYPERLSISTIRDEQDQIRNYVGLFYDISAEVSQREELDELANKDQLTGLPNRHAFLARLETTLGAARRAGRQLALLFVDLDNFKDINDCHGHAVGDHVLHTLAQRLRGCVRQSDYLARWGGDEMVVLLGDGVSAAGVAAVAAKIGAAISAPVPVADTAFHLTVSIGIALFPDHADTSSELIDKADAAMYRVKWSGRNGFAVAES